MLSGVALAFVIIVVVIMQVLAHLVLQSLLAIQIKIVLSLFLKS